MLLDLEILYLNKQEKETLEVGDNYSYLQAL